MSKKKVNALSDVAQLLAQFQKRLDALTSRVSENTEDILVLDDGLNEVDESTAELFEDLRDSVQKSFDNVSADVKVLLEENKRLNERVSQLESMVGGRPVDNKLDTVYSVITHIQKETDLRLKAVEAEIELITNFRKAQAAFVLGPTKIPETSSPLKAAEEAYEKEYGIKGRAKFNSDGNVVTKPDCDCDACNDTYVHDA